MIIIFIFSSISNLFGVVSIYPFLSVLSNFDTIYEISELAKNEDFNTISNENKDEENIDDFITEN